MAVFGVDFRNDSLSDSSIIKKYVAAVRTRLSLNDFLKNPFVSSSVNLVNPGLLVLVINPVFPAFYKGVAIITLALFLMFGWNWLMIFGVIGSLSGLFYSRLYYFFMFRRGLRKSGYKGVIKGVF
jgi:hypothetical protein